MKIFQSKITVLLLILCAEIVCFLTLSFFNKTVDTYYHSFVFDPITTSFRFLTSKSNIPFGQIIYYLILGFISTQFLLFIKRIIKAPKDRKKTFKAFFTKSLYFTTSLYFIYTIFWGLNYARTPLSEKLNFSTDSCSQNELIELCSLLIKNTNSSKHAIEQAPLTIDSIYEISSKIYQNNVLEIAHKPLSYPTIKSVYFPKIMSWNGLSGIYFPFTAEANINTDLPRFKIPFITCHELAHQTGIASESEANFYSFLMCQASQNPQFIYSANYVAMSYSLHALHQSDSTTYKRLYKTISPEVKSDIALSKKYWDNFESPIQIFNNWFYDLFLKANQQEAGIKSYGQMVELLISEKRKTGLKRFED